MRPTATDRGSAGFTLVELLVAMLLLSIAISMSFIVATNMDTVTVSTLRQSHAAESVQVGMSEVAQYLRGAVSPTAAAATQNATVASSPSCWGTSSPSPSGGYPLTPSGAASLAVVTASSFDLVYCGYAPASTRSTSSKTPGVYEITFAPGSCRGVGYCTLAVYSCGANYNPGAAAVASSTYTQPSTCVSSAGHPVWEVQNVWCDSSCQSGTAGGAPGDTPPLFSYYEGSAGEYSSTGAGGPALGSAAHPLGLASGDDAPGLQLVQLVVIRATVLANRNPDLTATGAGSGTQVSEQVWLTNMLSGGYQPASTASATLRLGPAGLWPLDSVSGQVVADASGNGNNGTLNGSVSLLDAGSPPLDTPLSVPVMSFGGSGFISTAKSVAKPGPQAFSVSAWFNTTSTTGGGGIIQYGDSQTGTPSNYDRQLYVGADGKLNFGVCDPTDCPAVVTSPAPVNNGKWYFAVATLSSAGMSLYLNGELVAFNPNVTEAQPFPDQGWWRIGGLGNDCGWPDIPSSCGAFDFNGQLADVAVYYKALGPSQVQGLYQSAGHYSTCYSSALAAYQPASMWPMSDPSVLDPTTSPSAADLAPAQDGNTATIQGSVGYGATPGAAPCAPPSVPAMSFNGGYLSTANQLPEPCSSSPVPTICPQTFSIVAWFKTTPGGDGGIVSFGNAQTGPSTNYDRHLYVGTDGKLHFAVWPYTQSIVSSPSTVNGGHNWHLAVATLSSAGQDLYLDGQLVGESSNTQAQNYAGWWRIGELAGPGWNYEGSGEFPFSGDIADVAVFPHALTGIQVQALYEAGQPS